MISDIEEAEAHQLARTHRCGDCGSRLVVAWQGAPPPDWGKGSYVLRCTKNAEHKGTKPDIDMGGVNMVNADSTSLVKYNTPLGPVELSVEAIRLYLSPKATVAEAYIFLQKCRFQKLNPFMGEAYLVIYEQTQTSPRGAQMMVGKEAHTRRAERHPDYQGMEAGVMVLRGGEVKEVAGAFLAPGDQLLGGWCKVHRKGREVPDFISVSLKEYDNGRRQWKQMPATMIRKVAVVQALREAFPNEMAGLQGGGEFDLAEEQPQVIEGKLASLPQSQSPAEAAALPTREVRNLERDIDDLFPNEPESIQEAPQYAAAVFDPDLEPPPPMPNAVHSLGHFEQILKDEGWTKARLEIDVLKIPLDRYIREGHKIQDAYLAWREHVANATR